MSQPKRARPAANVQVTSVVAHFTTLSNQNLYSSRNNHNTWSGMQEIRFNKVITLKTVPQKNQNIVKKL